MCKTRKTETENPHEKELEQILFKFVDDEMDYDLSNNEITEIIQQHTLKAIEQAKELRKNSV